MGSRKTTDGTGFASTLKVLRERAGLSQQALADKAGMHVLGVAKLEQGLREPGWPTVIVLAKALGVTPNDFLPPPPGTARKRRSPAG